jgi:hypothetical protein
MKQIFHGYIDGVILAFAVILWVFFFLMVMSGPGFGGNSLRFLVPTIALIGITCALYRLLRLYRGAWALAALLAPILAVGVLLLVAEACRRWS